MGVPSQIVEKESSFEEIVVQIHKSVIHRRGNLNIHQTYGKMLEFIRNRCYLSYIMRYNSTSQILANNVKL